MRASVIDSVHKPQKEHSLVPDRISMEEKACKSFTYIEDTQQVLGLPAWLNLQTASSHCPSVL